MGASGTPAVDWEFVLTKVRDMSTTVDQISKRAGTALLTSGTTVGQIDQIFHDTRSIATTGTDSINLISGLTNGVGDAVVLAKLKGLLVVASATNVNNVNIQRPVTTGIPLFLAASDGMAVRPGGYFSWFAADATGVAVTSGASFIDFVNSGGGTAVSYDLVLIGTTV